MLVMVAGFFLVCYLLVPGTIFRVCFALFAPVKPNRRNRAEEITYSAIVVFLPSLLAFVLMHFTCLGRSFPFQSIVVDKHAAYSTIMAGLLGAQTTAPILDCYKRAGVEQIRFLSALWVLVVLEGCGAAFLVRSYASFSERNPLRILCDKFLLRHVPEWDICFTPSIILGADASFFDVELDVLTNMNILYKGRVVGWYQDHNGNLAWLELTDTARYRRNQLEDDRKQGKALPTSEYWGSIPGSNLFLPASSIANLNLRYITKQYKNPVPADTSDDSGLYRVAKELDLEPEKNSRHETSTGK